MSKKIDTMGSKRKGEFIFYSLVIALPVLQYIIFYLVVNFNSVILAFKEYKLVDGVDTFIGPSLANFQEFFYQLSHGTAITSALKNSLTFYGVGLLVGVPLALLFSYYIYKGYLMSGFFRVMLYLPSIISSVVLIYMYKFFIDYGVLEVLKAFTGEMVEPPLADPNNHMGVMLFFNTACSFGVNVIMYSSAMTRIPVSITEYASLDGVKPLKEFFTITIPLIFPTITTFLVVGIAGIFTNQAHLYTMFSNNADIKVKTLGYNLFVNTVHSDNGKTYPLAASYGIIYTVVLFPITILVKKLLDKIDPNVQY